MSHLTKIHNKANS